MVTFNVIFTPASVERLLPFGLSLLNARVARVRLVGNGCEAGEDRLLAAVAREERRISHERLPWDHPVDHGRALDHLFERFAEPSFAFADSDVLARGDYLDGAWPPRDGVAAVFAAPPAWLTTDEAVVPPNSGTLSGRRSRLADGTPVGGTYFAVYDRAALESAWRAAPRGFGVHHWQELPRSLRARLERRGWRFRTYDTGRIVNLQLLLSGLELENRDLRGLHHVGGFSARDFEGAAGLGRTLAGLARSRSPGRLGRAARGALSRLYAALTRDPSRSRRADRRALVLGHLEQVVDAIAGDRAIPPQPLTDSPGVDLRVAALVDALRAEYPSGLERVRAAGSAEPQQARGGHGEAAA